MGCQHLAELYELFLLGALGSDEAGIVHEHVEHGCAHCLEQLREAAQTVYLLCLLTRQARPGPKNKSELLRRVRKK